MFQFEQDALFDAFIKQWHSRDPGVLVYGITQLVHIVQQVDYCCVTDHAVQGYFPSQLTTCQHTKDGRCANI